MDTGFCRIPKTVNKKVWIVSKDTINQKRKRGSESYELPG